MSSASAKLSRLAPGIVPPLKVVSASSGEMTAAISSGARPASSAKTSDTAGMESKEVVCRPGDGGA